MSLAIEPLERALLSLEGLSLGDAFGESFFTGDAAERVLNRRPSDGSWRWTDDTAMACSLLETLAAHGAVDQDDLARRFADRYREEPDRGYGLGMHRGLGEICAGKSWRTVATDQFGREGSFGNGAAMRTSVLGAWLADDLGEVAVQAARAAEVTYTHREGVAGAIAVAVAAALACRGGDCPVGAELVEAVLAYVPDREVRTRTAGALELRPGSAIELVVAALGNGTRVSAQDTVPLVLWSAAHAPDDFQEALWLTVSAFGDRDTSCAMAGGILACRVGREGLPHDWIARREPLRALALEPSAE
jgi:ADP-ribosylglycohydrolase